jgi:DNA-binding NarL/FixJ family response regulator
MPMTTRTAIVVEDEPLIRGLLEEILVGANFEVHTAGSALEARRILNRIEPDLALLDIDLGAGANGIDVAHIIEKKHLGTATIFLTKIPDIRATPSQMELPSGASFLRKELVGNPAYLLNAIETALTELGKVRHDAEPGRPLEMLTNTQVQVLRLLACGYTNAEIARRRKKSVSAVEQIIKTIFVNLEIQDSLELNQRVEATRIYIRAAGVPSREDK